MSEYIYIPEYFNEELIRCKLLEEFLKDSQYIEDRKININSLRRFYSEDKEKGIKLIDELQLRGFEFILEKPSILLETLEPNMGIELIFTEGEDNKISKVNKSIFN